MTDQSQKREALIVYGLVVLFLLLACSWQGMFFSDDVVYMETGQFVHLSSLLHNMSIAPLYALWFSLIGCLSPDAINRYFISWALLVIIDSAVPLWMRMRGAWLYTLIIIGLPIFYVLPYISLFAAIFFIVGICFIVRHKLTLTSALSLSCFLCFVVAFVRPEYAYGVFFCTVAAVCALVPAYLTLPARATAMKLLVVVCICAAAIYASTQSSNPGYGIAPKGTSRSGMAFAQHVNVRASKEGLLGNENPWHSSYALRIFKVDPGHNAGDTHATIGDFFRANPRLFLAHIIANLFDVRAIALLVFVLTIALWPWFSERCAHLRPASSYAALISLPVLISSVLIYPRLHYLIIIFPSFLILSIEILLVYRFVRTPPVLWTLLAGFFLIFIVAISHKHSNEATVARSRSNPLLVDCLRRLEESEEGRNGLTFDVIDINNIFFNARRRYFTDVDIPDFVRFMSWTEKVKPGWVVVTPEVASIYHVTNAQISQFLIGDMNYTPHPCPKKTATILYVLSK